MPSHRQAEKYKSHPDQPANYAHVLGDYEYDLVPGGDPRVHLDSPEPPGKSGRLSNIFYMNLKFFLAGPDGLLPDGVRAPDMRGLPPECLWLPGDIHNNGLQG